MIAFKEVRQAQACALKRDVRARGIPGLPEFRGKSLRNRFRIVTDVVFLRRRGAGQYRRSLVRQEALRQRHYSGVSLVPPYLAGVAIVSCKAADYEFIQVMDEPRIGIVCAVREPGVPALLMQEAS